MVDNQLERLQTESNAMIQYLKKLEKQERDLNIQTQILAREAINNGWTHDNIGLPHPKKKRPAAKKQENNKES